MVGTSSSDGAASSTATPAVPAAPRLQRPHPAGRARRRDGGVVERPPREPVPRVGHAAPLRPSPELRREGRRVHPLLTAAVVGWAERLVDTLRTEHQFADCAIHLADGPPERLVLAARSPRAAWDPAGLPAIPGGGAASVPLDSTLGLVFRTGAPALVADSSLDGDVRRGLGDRSRSLLAVPIVVAGQTIGVLHVESSRVGTFGIRDLERVLASLTDAVRGFPTALAL